MKLERAGELLHLSPCPEEHEKHQDRGKHERGPGTLRRVCQLMRARRRKNSVHLGSSLMMLPRTSLEICEKRRHNEV